MFGAIIKSYWAEKNNIDPENIVTVSVMPCVAKKFECGREEMEVGGNRDVDIVISATPGCKNDVRAGINLTSFPMKNSTDTFEESSGAAVIFGATGGVMEAALRTVRMF